MNDALSYAALLEAERARIAGQLERGLLESLALLLAQATSYEQAFAAQPQARMAFSVLIRLIRETLQQVHDLQQALHPTSLQHYGLEAALEALAAGELRAHGLQIALQVPHLRERRPPLIELTLYRAAQALVTQARTEGRASRVDLSLLAEADELTLTCRDNGTVALTGSGSLRGEQVQIQALGGTFRIEAATPPAIRPTTRITFRIASPPALTDRERAVLHLLADGLSNKEIGAAVGVSVRTVKFHLDNLYSKLGVNSRTEAILLALRQGWLSLSGSTGPR